MLYYIMSYYEKYIKYKNKYLELRKQYGGSTPAEWDEFNRLSTVEYDNAQQQRSAGQYIEDCPHGYYNLTDFEGDYIQLQIDKIDKKKCPNCDSNLKKYEFIKSTNDLYWDVPRVKAHTSRTSKNNTLGKYDINHICQQNRYNKIYFVNDELISFVSNNIFNINNTIIPPNMIQNTVETITLDISKYENVFQNTTRVENKSIICLEGNIIFADAQSKIGSGAINTCLFIALILDNESCIALHLNGMINNTHYQYATAIKNEVMNYNFTYENFHTYITTNFGSLINTVKKIFVGGITTDYFFDRQDNLIYQDRDTFVDGRGESIQSINEDGLREIFKRKLGITRNPEIQKSDNVVNIIIHNGNIYTFGTVIN